jgi:hypothetical protein
MELSAWSKLYNSKHVTWAARFLPILGQGSIFLAAGAAAVLRYLFFSIRPHVWSRVPLSKDNRTEVFTPSSKAREK